MAEMCNMTMRIENLNVKTKTNLISKIICSKNAKRFPIMGHVYTLGKNSSLLQHLPNNVSQYNYYNVNNNSKESWDQ